MLHPDLTAEIARQRQEALRASARPRRRRRRVSIQLAPPSLVWLGACLTPAPRPRPW